MQNTDIGREEGQRQDLMGGTQIHIQKETCRYKYIYFEMVELIILGILNNDINGCYSPIKLCYIFYI